MQKLGLGIHKKKSCEKQLIDNIKCFSLGAEYTMPGWAGSSWYFYRYMDAQNSDSFVGKEAVEYWKEVDLYLGGSEHATGHLLYSRFWQKFLFDLGFITSRGICKKIDQPRNDFGDFSFCLSKARDSNLPF